MRERGKRVEGDSEIYRVREREKEREIVYVRKWL